MCSFPAYSGNTGKAFIQDFLRSLDEPSRSLDVGISAPPPLELWRPIDVVDSPLDVVGVDSDREGIAEAEELNLGIALYPVSGYDLITNFGRDSFDMVVSTQVLEHVRDPQRFLREVRGVLKGNGLLLRTADSAHFSRSRSNDRGIKRLLRLLASRVSERYYDFGLFVDRLGVLLRETSFEVGRIVPCNIGPLKPMIAELEGEARTIFIRSLTNFEMQLHQEGFRKPEWFRGLYVEARAI